MDIRWPFWQEVRKLLVDRQDGTYAERVEAYPPTVLMTDDDGPYARLRVDPGQTGFWAGREFRVFEEFSIAAGTSKVWRMDATTVQFVLQSITCQLWENRARFELLSAGGTESGTFNVPVQPRRTNLMTSADLTYLGQVSVSTGGGYTGGTVTEATELNTGTGSGRHIEIISDVKPYGVTFGTYYIRVTSLAGTARGAINVRWEERP